MSIVKTPLLAATFLLTAGCTVRDADPADTAGIPDSVVAVPVSPQAAEGSDSGSTGVASPADSQRQPPSDRSGNLTGETTKRGGTLGSDSIIGRDSAFGPRGMMDERGNITPIPQKKR